MPKITCKLIYQSNSGHIQQLLTGFRVLYKKGLIDLSQQINHSNIINPIILRVVVNGKLRLHYDMFDGSRIAEQFLDNCDFYFKRSYSSSYIDSLRKNNHKIKPLGLNYHVYPDEADFFAFRRSFRTGNMKTKILQMVRSLNIFNKIVFTPRIRTMQSKPDYDAEPKILFMVRAWDPFDKPERSNDQIDYRIRINEFRAECIRALRNEFGRNFYGGFSHTKYATENYEDCLLPDNRLSSKRNYISLLRSYPICVATTGLHGSIGWKFGEYVAFSKAILSEKLNYEVPGNLEAGKNYLEYSTPEACVDKASRLLQVRELRNYIMASNAKYYHSYVKPDALVLNSLLTALSEYE